MNKKVSFRHFILVLIGLVGLISINFTTIESTTFFVSENGSEIIDSGTPVDCWKDVRRPGGEMLVRACEIEVGGICYNCKWVTDAYFVDLLSTCTPDD